MPVHIIRIVLADDQPIVRQGLRFVLDRQPDMTVVGEARDGPTAVAVVTHTAPDIVLMDIQMPRATGIEATRILHTQSPQVRVILLTTFDREDYVADGIRAGALGYLLKDADTEDLVEGIRWVNAGQVL